MSRSSTIKVKKLLFLVVTIGSMFLYFPVNQLARGGISLESVVDRYILLVPAFVIPYVLGILFWVVTIIYINLGKNSESIKKFNTSIILASIISVLIYIFLPTFVVRPETIGNDIFSNILRFVYSNDRPYNAAPSGHTFYTMLCFFTLYKEAPKYRALWFVIAIIIISSTLFTKQHNFLDVVWGVIFGCVVYFLTDIKKPSWL